MSGTAQATGLRRSHPARATRSATASRLRRPASSRPVRQSQGRPKGAKNKRPALHEERLKEIILDEAYRGINGAGRRSDRDGPDGAGGDPVDGRQRGQGPAPGAAALRRASVIDRKRTTRSCTTSGWTRRSSYKVEWEKELHRRARLGHHRSARARCRIPTT